MYHFGHCGRKTSHLRRVVLFLGSPVVSQPWWKQAFHSVLCLFKSALQPHFIRPTEPQRRPLLGKTLPGFSTNLAVVLDALIQHKTFLRETLMWLNIMRFHGKIRVAEKFINKFCVFFLVCSCTGGLRRTLGLCEESSFCYRIWNLILGCIWQLAHMVGFPYKCRKSMKLRGERQSDPVHYTLSDQVTYGVHSLYFTPL